MVDMCIVCRRPKAEHAAGSECPPRVTYFTPCTHPRQQGTAAMGVDGMGWSDMTCMDCGERFMFGTAPGQENTVRAQWRRE